jgi:hypothetical protein
MLTDETCKFLADCISGQYATRPTDQTGDVQLNAVVQHILTDLTSHTIIDYGCGNGALLNELITLPNAHNRRYIGINRSDCAEAQQHSREIGFDRYSPEFYTVAEFEAKPSLRAKYIFLLNVLHEIPVSELATRLFYVLEAVSSGDGQLLIMDMSRLKEGEPRYNTWNVADIHLIFHRSARIYARSHLSKAKIPLFTTVVQPLYRMPFFFPGHGSWGLYESVLTRTWIKKAYLAKRIREICDEIGPRSDKETKAALVNQLVLYDREFVNLVFDLDELQTQEALADTSVESLGNFLGLGLEPHFLPGDQKTTLLKRIANHVASTIEAVSCNDTLVMGGYGKSRQYRIADLLYEGEVSPEIYWGPHINDIIHAASDIAGPSQLRQTLIQKQIRLWLGWWVDGRIIVTRAALPIIKGLARGENVDQMSWQMDKAFDGDMSVLRRVLSDLTSPWGVVRELVGRIWERDASAAMWDFIYRQLPQLYDDEHLWTPQQP